MEVAVMLSLMLKFVCESCELRVFSSPPTDGAKCHMAVELEGDNILDNMKRVLALENVLGGCTDFPYDYIEELISTKRHIDQMFIFSDMMISPGEDHMSSSISGENWTVAKILTAYREQVNPDMLFVTVDLAGSGRSALGAELEDDFRNVLVTGYSDAILRLVSEIQSNQVNAVREAAAALIAKKHAQTST
jgi:hypothetical protein